MIRVLRILLKHKVEDRLNVITLKLLVQAILQSAKKVMEATSLGKIALQLLLKESHLKN